MTFCVCWVAKAGSNRTKVFLGKSVLKICSKFTGEHTWQSTISTKLQRNFIEIALRHECSPVYLLHIFRTPFPKNTSGGLLLIQETKPHLKRNRKRQIRTSATVSRTYNKRLEQLKRFYSGKN